jgi:predicted phosphoribosyltransferase
MFQDRRQAGHRLAKKLLRYRDLRPVVLALPRGGVPVAVEVARELDAPLDVLLVRKIGAPWQRDMAVGAVVGGSRPQVVLNEELIAATGVSQDYIDREIANQLREIDRRRRIYQNDRRAIDLRGRVVIVVDDNAATGASLRVAVRGVKLAGASTVVLAVPVVERDVADLLGGEVDDLVCLLMPERLGEINGFYKDFRQVHDDEVTALLAQAGSGGNGHRASA